MTKTSIIGNPSEVRLLACISHLFRPERLMYLSEVLVSLYGLCVARLDIIVFTDAGDPDDLLMLERLFFKFTSPSVTVSISSHPEVRKNPKTLPWVNRAIMKQEHADALPQYTHYLYLEDDMLFSHANLVYFLKFRVSLRPFGLLPGMVRYEYNSTSHDVFTAGQLGKQDFLSKTRVVCQDIEFINLDEPYAAMFLLDREMMDGYLSSQSFDIELSAAVVGWGSIQRAAMGLTWERVPAGFRNRCVVPLRSKTTVPDAICWVKHLTGSYTNDYSDTANFLLGKTRMDEIFLPFSDDEKQAPYTSCYSSEDIPTRSISFFDELYPEASYQRPLPIVEAGEAFRNQLERICRAVNDAHSSIRKSMLVSFASAYIFGPVIYVETNEEPALLLETYRPNDRDFVTAPHPHVILDTFVEYGFHPNTCSIFIGSAGSFNYGHWLVDDLPRLKAIYTMREMFPDRQIRILLSTLGNPIGAIRKQSTERYLSSMDNYTIEFLDCRIPYKIHDLFYASPVSLHPATKSPPAIAWVSEQAASLSDDASPPPGDKSRLFVTRRPPDSRTLLNHEEVAQFLSLYGFAMADMNGLDFSQQVSLFKHAEVIVGCMGAAMTNTILCKRPATIVMLAPEGWIEPFYWDLAAVRGDRYVACYGEPNNKNVAANASSYTIDIVKLASLINGLGLMKQGDA